MAPDLIVSGTAERLNLRICISVLSKLVETMPSIVFLCSVKELVGQKQGDAKIVSDADFDIFTCWMMALRNNSSLSRSAPVKKKPAGGSARSTSQSYTLATKDTLG